MDKTGHICGIWFGVMAATGLGWGSLPLCFCVCSRALCELLYQISVFFNVSIHSWMKVVGKKQILEFQACQQLRILMPPLSSNREI